MKIRVFTDLRFTSNPRVTGVGKHIVQMVGGLAGNLDHEVSLIRCRDQAATCGPLAALPSRQVPLPWKVAEAVWTLTGCPKANRWTAGSDWVYCPKNDFIPLTRERVAVTVHGAHELDPQYPQSKSISARLNRIRRRLHYQRMLDQASLVLSVSEFLKEQVIAWFGIPEEKVSVVGNGVEPEYFEASGNTWGRSGQSSSRPFVLCVGGLNELDGGDRILRVAEVLLEKAPDLEVLIAGGDHSPELVARASAASNVRLLGYVASTMLANFMRDAVALLYPTRYETFGIAAAEAMAAGTPVVATRATGVPEILGDAGLYASDDDPQEMAGIIQQLVDDSRLRSIHSDRGLIRAKKYTWSACVARLEAALHSHR